MTEDPSYQFLHRTPSDRVQKSSVGNSISQSNNTNSTPRSCVTCRKRKVKCDKKQPCSNCTKAKIECVFPLPGRAPRKSRKPPDNELIERLRKLEGVVQSLGIQVEEEGVVQAIQHKSRQKAQSPIQMQEQRNIITPPTVTSRPPEDSTGRVCPKWKKEQDLEGDYSIAGLETRFGRLVVDEGKSRYINNSFWASLNSEVEDLKGILNEDTTDDENYSSPESNISSNTSAFIFGFSSQNVDMHSLHPSSHQIPKYWEIFKENVDPLVKVLHVPTIEPKILDAINHLEKLPKGLEALLFSIYYGVVTSLLPDDCIKLLGEERAGLLVKYRFGLEQALARANFLISDEMIVLQAFVIFLMLLRRNDDARVIWTVTGLAVRIAQTLGIHRDGSHFSLSPFEIEMRRRLWWQVCILDSRASEDHGCDPTIVEALFDTQMPLNVNDSDLHPDMTGFPQEREGPTEMLFSLIRFEVANTLRRIQWSPPGKPKCGRYYANASLERKAEWIKECHEKLEKRYLQHCDMTVPLHWMTATVSRLIMSKMWLMIYHPFQRLDGGASLPQETKDKLFVTSLENVEYSILLETESRTMKWGWLFRTYVQWHAIAFLLSELCVRTQGEHVERAWRAVETTMARRGSEHASEKKGCLWRPLRKLMAKAQTARERATAGELDVANIGRQDGPLLYGVGVGQIPVNLTHHLDTYEDIDALLQSSASTITRTVPSLHSEELLNTRDFLNSPQPHPQSPPSLQNITSSMATRPTMSLILRPDDAVTRNDSFDWILANSPTTEAHTALTVGADDSMNWAQFDDMVKEFGLQPRHNEHENSDVSIGGGIAGFDNWY